MFSSDSVYIYRVHTVVAVPKLEQRSARLLQTLMLCERPARPRSHSTQQQHGVLALGCRWFRFCCTWKCALEEDLKTAPRDCRLVYSCLRAQLKRHRTGERCHGNGVPRLFLSHPMSKLSRLGVRDATTTREIFCADAPGLVQHASHGMVPDTHTRTLMGCRVLIDGCCRQNAAACDCVTTGFVLRAHSATTEGYATTTRFIVGCREPWYGLALGRRALSVGGVRFTCPSDGSTNCSLQTKHSRMLLLCLQLFIFESAWALWCVFLRYPVASRDWCDSFVSRVLTLVLEPDRQSIVAMARCQPPPPCSKTVTLLCVLRCRSTKTARSKNERRDQGQRRCNVHLRVRVTLAYGRGGFHSQSLVSCLPFYDAICFFKPRVKISSCIISRHGWVTSLI